MSCDIGDAVSTLRDIAVEINCFLYKDGKGRYGVREGISLEECISKLQDISNHVGNQYDSTARYLGWKE